MPEPTDNPLRRLLVTNQVVGPLMVQLLDGLEESGTHCLAVTGRVDRCEDQKLRFTVIDAADLRKRPAWKRIWTWGVFALQSARQMLRHRRTPALVVSNPPVTALLCPVLKRLFGVRYALLVYDVYPEAAERTGMIGRRAGNVWRALSRRAMLDAEGVVTIGTRMARTLQTHLRNEEPLHIDVLPNWADTDFVRPIPKPHNPFAREHGLVDKLVVTYSGAFGATHDVASIVTAAELLQDRPEVHFMLIGGGTREAEVRDLVQRKNLPNLTLLPLQPWGVVPQSFAVADLSIVCLDEAYKGISVPSKTYYALAAGAALLAISPPDTELTDLVAEEQCGRHVLPRDPHGLAEAVRHYCRNREELRQAGGNARRAAEQKYSQDVMIRQWVRTLRRMLG
ncbi:MAG: glycosyltransferase family 4 protein [Phycisphaerae bacterium]